MTRAILTSLITLIIMIIVIAILYCAFSVGNSTFQFKEWKYEDGRQAYAALACICMALWMIVNLINIFEHQ